VRATAGQLGSALGRGGAGSAVDPARATAAANAV
jgi:hypothetical protein